MNSTSSTNGHAQAAAGNGPPGTNIPVQAVGATAMPRGPPPSAGGMYRGPPPPPHLLNGARPPMPMVPPAMPLGTGNGMQVPPMEHAAPSARGSAPPMRPPVRPSQPVQPQAAGPELPAGWSVHYTPQGLPYYHNVSTGVTTYEHPAASAQEGKWVEYFDNASQKPYYYHTGTKVTVWEKPEDYIPSQEPKVKKKSSSNKLQKELEEKRKEYKQLSREERVKLFKEFLEEKELTPPMKWPDVQRAVSRDEKWSNDPRWVCTLKSVGDRKQIFAEFSTQISKARTVERRRQIKRQREEFIELLSSYESLLTSAMQTQNRNALWQHVSRDNEWAHVRQDSRWKALEEQQDDKESLFETFVADVEKKQKAARAHKHAQLQESFQQSLRQKCHDGEIHVVSRLDTDTKRQVMHLAQTLVDEADDDLKYIRIDKGDIYDWTESIMKELLATQEKKKDEERALEEEAVDTLKSKVHDLVDAFALPLTCRVEQFQSLAPDPSGRVKEKTRKRILERALKAVKRSLSGPTNAIERLLQSIPTEINLETFKHEVKKAAEAHASEDKYEQQIAQNSELPLFVDRVYENEVTCRSSRKRRRSHSTSRKSRKVSKEEEESARAEEIIRQAQVERKDRQMEEEMEEGEITE